MNDILGPMGTATAESLRAVGLEPDPPPPLPARRPAHAPDLFIPRGFAFGRGVRSASTFAGIVLIAVSICGGAAALYRRTVDEPREILRQLAHEMDESLDLAVKQARIEDDQLRELRAQLRRVEEAQDRLVRAERRARRLAGKGRAK